MFYTDRTTSRVVLGTSVTFESIGSFLSGFIIYEGFKKYLAPMPLAKVWANSVRVPNPRWPPSTILKIIFAMVWLTILHSIRFWGFLGSRNSFLISFWWFDLLLTFKSNMAADFQVENGNFWKSSYHLHIRLKWKLCSCRVELLTVKLQISAKSSSQKSESSMFVVDRQPPFALRDHKITGGDWTKYVR